MDFSRLALIALVLLPALSVTSALEIGNDCENIIGAHEEDGECVCDDPDQIIDSGKSHCITVAFEGYGSACNDTLQCATRMKAGGVCYNNKCRCAEKYHYLHGVCWPTRKFGEKCRSSEECYNSHESDAYECVSGECACAQGAYKFRAQDGFVMCRRIAEVNEECETTMDCNGSDSSCKLSSSQSTDYICVSNGIDTTTLVNAETTTTATESPATESPATESPATESPATESPATEPLAIELLANEPESTTPESTTPDSTTTDFITTESTTATPPCSAEGEQLTEKGDCICRNGYFKPSSSSKCVPELGEPCSLTKDRPDGHSAIVDSSCRRSAKSGPENTDQGIWACLGGFLAVLDNRECSKTREHTMNCPQGDVQCAYYGGVCESGSCRCPSGFHYSTEKTVCWPSKGLYEDCNEHADCSVTTSDSIWCDFNQTNGLEDVGNCTCKSGFHPADDDCRVDALALRDTCTDPSDCLFANGADWVTCTGRRCACAVGYYTFNTTYCGTGVGGACKSDRDCEEAENTACNTTTEKCQCREDFVGRGNYRGCVPVATEYGQECEEEDQCKPLTPNQNSIYCLDVCTCGSNFHFKDNYCWNSVQLEKRCNVLSECIANNSVCKNGFCTCMYDFIQDGDHCVPGSAPFGQTASPSLALLLVFLAYISR